MPKRHNETASPKVSLTHWDVAGVLLIIALLLYAALIKFDLVF